jgi:Chalcone isomerase-like
MRLNGIGLRTFSVLGIRIYVAGLYLERRNSDTDTILHSQEGRCSTSGFCATWVPRMPERHGSRASSKIARLRATLIRTTFNGSSQRFHLYTRAMVPRCYLRRGAST